MKKKRSAHGRVALRLPVLLALSLACTTSINTATEAQGNEVTPQRTYKDVLSTCSMNSSAEIQLLKAFRGLIPIPSNFVLVDATNDHIEYSDLAHPWRRPKKPSTVFYAPKQKFDERWGWLTQLPAKPGGEVCGIEVHKYDYMEQFRAPAAVLTDGSEYLLFVGPVVDAADDALACYRSILRQLRRTC